MAAAATGLLALLGGWWGALTAEVVMVILAAVTGALLRSSCRETSGRELVWSVCMSVLVSLVLSWALVGWLDGLVPSLSGPYSSSIIALMLGVVGGDFRKLPALVASLWRPR